MICFVDILNSGMILNRTNRSESEPAEEELGVSSLLVLLGIGKVSQWLAEGLPQWFPESLSGLLGLKVVVLDVLKVELAHQETSGQHMVLVYVLHEGLHAGLLDELLLAVSALHLGDMASDTGDQKVGESVLLK